MSDPLRPTLPQTELKDNLIHPAPIGRRVIAINKGGVACFTVVTKDFGSQFDAWGEFPKIPQSVKDRQSDPTGKYRQAPYPIGT